MAERPAPAGAAGRTELPLETGTLECSLGELGPLEIRQVRRTPDRKGSLMGCSKATITWDTLGPSGSI